MNYTGAIPIKGQKLTHESVSAVASESGRVEEAPGPLTLDSLATTATPLGMPLVEREWRMCYLNYTTTRLV